MIIAIFSVSAAIEGSLLRFLLYSIALYFESLNKIRKTFYLLFFFNGNFCLPLPGFSPAWGP